MSIIVKSSQKFYLLCASFLIIELFTNSLMPRFVFGDEKIKRPNVSGQFYSDNPKELSSDIDRFMHDAAVIPLDKHVDIIIVPHAGYIYSGGVAAYGFKAASRNQYKTIVVLAPSHFVGFDGISIWPEGSFQTPLGAVDVDQEFTKKLTSFNANFYFYPPAFEREHSLEVEIPFLQKTFKDFKIVPVIMGQPSPQLLSDFAKALNQVIGNRKDILIVVSSDMSHYHEDSFARKMDYHTIDAIKGLDAKKIWEECHLGTMELCGVVPVTAAMFYVKERGLKNVTVLRYANSGDVTGDKKSVVGYSATIISEEESAQKEETIKETSSFTLDEKRRLLKIARETIEKYIRTGETLDIKETDKRLMKNEEGVFVTIHRRGQLRGCIGNILATGPLSEMVRNLAIASATQDPRFHPVQKEELDDLELEVSILSKPRGIQSVDEIKLGTQGVIVSQGPFHQGIFLPQVATETGWTKEEFLSQLCVQKAGLPPDAWKDSKTKIDIFTAEVFSEKDVH